MKFAWQDELDLQRRMLRRLGIIAAQPRAYALCRQGKKGQQKCIEMQSSRKRKEIQIVWWFGIMWIIFPSYWECHHPNWRTHIFQRGRLNHQPAKVSAPRPKHQPSQPPKVNRNCRTAKGDNPSGNLFHSYWKLPFIVDWPIENGDFP